MDAALRRSDGGEEKRGESSGDEGGCMEEVVLKIGKRRRAQEDDDNTKPLPNQNGQLESAKAEMGEVKEENQRLKMHLNRIMKDYQTLQMQFFDIVKHDPKKPTNAVDNDHRKESEEEPEFVSLSLGGISKTSIDLRKDEKPRNGKEDQEDKEGLTLGLESKFEVSKTESMETSLKLSPENSSDEVRDKIPNTVRSGDDDVLSQQNPVKKARVSVRIRCDTPTMNDGCQWRKYGQKIAKGNPCPRAYYRCTVAPSCPVRKQVQRCSEDMSILITTYEGTHNHPLPLSATAMASTTSAAASMILSGSSSSGTTISASDFRGMNFYLSDNLKPKQFCVPNNHSISSSPSYPTITLDLTSTSSSSTSSHFNNKFPSHFLSNNSRYSSTNLNFSSLESNPLSMAWSNNTVLNNYGNQPYNKNQIGSLNFGRQPQENFYNSFMQKSNPSPPQQPMKADTIAAATKAIASDPNFQSALAAALTSIMGTSGGGSGDSGGGVTLAYHGGGDKFGQNLKLGEPFPVASNLPSNAQSSNKFSSNYLNRSTSATNSQPSGSMLILQPPLPLSTPKSKSTSSGERDHII